MNSLNHLRLLSGVKQTFYARPHRRRVTAVIASWIAARLSLKRFVSEKWWKKKAEAYAAILESLHYLKRDFEKDLDATQTGREVPENRRKKSQESYREARAELNSVPTSVSIMVIWDW